MNKSDLVNMLATRAEISHKKAEEVVNTIFDSMAKTLLDGGRIEIRGFGSFANKEYKAYQGRNPKTKETIHIAAKRLPFFKVGKELKRRVDAGQSAESRALKTESPEF